MNDLRLKAYCGLIERLLDCPQGEEMLLLEGYPDLMNQELLTVMEQVAQMLRRQGKPNGDWLDQVAQRLSLLIPEEPIAPGNAREFLHQTIEIIISAEGKTQRLYLWLEEHSSYLNQDVLTALSELENRLQDVTDSQYLYLLALSLGCFANVLMDLPLGDRIWNLRCARLTYEIIGRIFQSLREPELWTATQESLFQTERELIALSQRS